jgi:hypothetical protein
MASEFCPRCGQGRSGTLRFCRSCKFDFEPAKPGARAATRPRLTRPRLLGVGVVIAFLAVGSLRPPSTDPATAGAETANPDRALTAADPTPTPTPLVTPRLTPTPVRALTPEPTQAPPPTPLPTPAPVVATYSDLVTAGLQDRAIFRGVVGTYTWSMVDFPAEQVLVRWDATSNRAACRVDWSIDPYPDPPINGTIPVGAADRAQGSTRYNTAFATGAVTVESNCSKFLVTMQGSNPAPVSVARPAGGNCHPSYIPCLPIVGDLDCPDVRAMGKDPVEVIGRDAYRLDGDGDGIGCE